MSTSHVAPELAERQRLITVDEYNKMAEAGIFAPDERTELIEGVLTNVPIISALRASIIMRMRYRLSELLGRRALVAVRADVIISDLSEPQADLAVLAWKEDFYRTGTPRTSDIIALIEIADALPAFSRDRKLPVYAQAQVAECWIVDVIARKIEVYRHGECAGFGMPTIRSEGQPIALSAFPELMLSVDELLG